MTKYVNTMGQIIRKIDNQKITRQKGDVLSYDKNKYQVIKKGADITRLAEKIIKNIKVSTSKENFIFNMQKDGYFTEWEENKKHIVFTVEQNILKGKKDKFRLSNLEKTFDIPDFRKEKLLEIFKLNKENERKESLNKIASQMGFEKTKEKNIMEKKVQERNLKTPKKQEKGYEFELQEGL